jgi:capsular polysaccharide biosynthesis protein
MEIKLSESFVCFRKKPVNVTIDTEHLYMDAYEKKIVPTYILVASDLSILDDSLYSLKLNHFYIQETHLSESSFSLQNKLERLSLFVRPYIILDKGVWITMNWTEMYYHWICDALTRLTMCLSYLDGHKVLLPESYRQLPFVVDSLALLGITPFFYNTNKRVKVKEVVLPSHVADSGHFNRPYLIGLRTLFAPFFAEKQQRRIFVSRSNSPTRYLDNESELYPILLRYGFEIVYFEAMTFKEQIVLSSQSSVICGLHGAGFTNMLFMPEGSKVFEIQIENKQNNCFFSMSSELGFDYWFVVAKSISSVASKVDICEFEHVLKQIIAY